MTNLIKTDTTPIGENLPPNHINVLFPKWIQEQKEPFNATNAVNLYTHKHKN